MGVVLGWRKLGDWVGLTCSESRLGLRVVWYFKLGGRGKYGRRKL